MGVLDKTGSRATFQMQKARIFGGDADESEFRQVHLDPCVLMHTSAQGARVKTDLNDPLGFLREMVKNRSLGLEGSLSG